MPYCDPTQQTGPFFKWSKDIETGIRLIDIDHRSLVDIVNEMHEQHRAGTFEAAVPNLIRLLLQYCTEHFFREEKIMEEYGYPGLRLHRERHRGILRFVHALRVVALDRPERIDPDKMLRFLQDWLVNHIGKSDMDYVKHIRQSMLGVGARHDGESLEESLPAPSKAKEVKIELTLPPQDALLIQQIAEIVRHSRADALELEKLTQEVLNRSTFQIPFEECEELIHDLMR